MNENKIKEYTQQNISDNGYELSIQDYVTILRIHYRKILFFTIIGLCISLYWTFTIPPTFVATSSVEIQDRPGADMVMDFSGRRDQNRLINEIQVIQSRSLAKEVIKELWNSNRRNNLHIFGTRKFYPKGHNFRNFLKELVTLGIYDPHLENPKKYNENYDESIGEKFTEKLMSRLSLSNIKNTNIIKISYSSPNADEARRISNLISRSYVRYDRYRNRDNARRAVSFLDSLVNNQENKIEEKEIDIRDFQLKNKMYSLDGDAESLISELNQYESQLYNITSEINIRKEKATIFRSRLTQEEKYLANKLTNDINSELNTIRFEIGRMESEITQNINTYGPNHMAVIALKERLNILKDNLKNKVSILISEDIDLKDPLKSRQEMMSELLSLETEIVGFELRLSEINKLLDIFNQKLNQLPKRQMQLARLKRDQDILNQNYGFLRNKLEDAKVNVAVKNGNAVILDIAKRPDSPISPDHQRTIMLGLFLGFIFGLFLSFLIEFLDNTLKTIDEIEKYRLTVLGIIPSMGSAVPIIKRKFIFWKDNKLAPNANGNILRRLITKEDPKSPVSEAYRSLRTSMLYSSDNELKSILISSAGPGEGKTTTVANLAITYANLGKKTILVDTDLRRPVIHKVFETEREPGVTNYLSNQTDDIDSLIQQSDIENLSLITSGIIPPNPSEMLGSKRMIKLVRSLEEKWDMVLFDSPPLVAVTDANMISKEIDRIVLVVKVGQTDKKAFHHTITNLKNIEAPLGGIIMNAVTNKSSYGSYYYYYYHQYYNYYGSDKES
ncbi:MAG: GumC family protein [Candidatus Neomarinimicrobiota bacterium]